MIESRPIHTSALNGTSLGFGLVGCGYISERYGFLLKKEKIEGAHLVAACDINPSKAQAFNQRLGVPSFSDVPAMMTHFGKEIDALCILTPSGSHAQLCLECVPYGKTIIIEKTNGPHPC